LFSSAQPRQTNSRSDGKGDAFNFGLLFGPINHDAVERIMEVRWDEDGRATGLSNAS
jgi:hypothetical protein